MEKEKEFKIRFKVDTKDLLDYFMTEEQPKIVKMDGAKHKSWKKKGRDEVMGE